MEVFSIFFVTFMAFIVLSIIKSEKDRKRRAAERKLRVPPMKEEFDTDDFVVPEPTTAPQDNTYHGEEVPRTTMTEVHEAPKAADKVFDLDLDPEKMIIYSEILKPKF